MLLSDPMTATKIDPTKNIWILKYFQTLDNWMTLHHLGITPKVTPLCLLVIKPEAWCVFFSCRVVGGAIHTHAVLISNIFFLQYIRQVGMERQKGHVLAPVILKSFNFYEELYLNIWSPTGSASVTADLVLFLCASIADLCLPLVLLPRTSFRDFKTFVISSGISEGHFRGGK